MILSAASGSILSDREGDQDILKKNFNKFWENILEIFRNDLENFEKIFNILKKKNRKF